MNARAWVRNKTWAELRIGASASIERTCSVQDLVLFAHVSGNVNPLMLPAAGGAEDKTQPLAPSMWVGSLISAVLGNLLPGPGTLYRSQNLRFVRRVHVGDKVKVTVACLEKREEPVAVFETKIEDAYGRAVCEGTAEVDAPTVSQVTEARELPALIIDTADHFAKLIALAAKLPPLRTAVVCPEDRNSLGGALLSANSGLAEPLPVGDRRRIEAAATNLGADISAFEIVSISDPHAAAARAVAMIREGRANAVMKGAIHSDATRSSLRSSRRTAAYARGGASVTRSRWTCRRWTRSSTFPTQQSTLRPTL
jgi:phosphate butyryltransferase